MRISGFVFASLLPMLPLAHAQPPAAPPAAKIADIAWLQGYWDGEGFGGQVEDLWMPPRAGMMLGSFRVVKAGAPSMYELMCIEEFAGSLRFVSRRFNPDFTQRDAGSSIALTGIGPREAAFDFLALKRDGDDAMVIEVTLKPKDKPERVEVLRYKRRAIPF